MADFNQHNEFGSNRPTRSTDAQSCARFEAMLADAVDGTLSAGDQAAFDAHLPGCPSCTASLADAQRGVTFLAALRAGPPEPPADLVSRILARTAAEAAGQAGPVASEEKSGDEAEAGVAQMTPVADTSQTGIPPLFARAPGGATALTGGGAMGGLGAVGAKGAKVLPFRRRMAAYLEPLRHTVLQPRLAMTAAMAFFSVAVTMNLTGVHITQMRASDLSPSSLKRNFYEANAHVVRYYDNLRVVYELESRVHDLQRSAEVNRPESPVVQPAEMPGAKDQQGEPATPGAAPDATPEKQVRPRPKPGTSLREPLLPDLRYSAALGRPGPGGLEAPVSNSGMSGADLIAGFLSEESRPTQERELA